MYLNNNKECSSWFIYTKVIKIVTYAFTYITAFLFLHLLIFTSEKIKNYLIILTNYAKCLIKWLKRFEHSVLIPTQLI